MSQVARIKSKVERAKEHVRELERSVQAFRNSDPYGFRIEDDLQTGDKVHRIHIRSETPDRFALLIGDVVHNLRSALDHLAWQLVVANGQMPKSGPGGTQFPIYEPKPGAKTPQGVVQGISAEAQKVIDRMKPYKGGNNDLWMLQQLDITDKHKLLIVTAFALSGVMPTFPGAGGYAALRAHVTSVTPKDGIVDMNLSAEVGDWRQNFKVCVPVGVQTDGSLPVLQDGALVARILAPVKQEAKFDLEFEITINEPLIVGGKPVLPLLTHLADVVNGFIDQFGVAGCLT